MKRLTLYGCPKACSLVSHIALEKLGIPFEYRFVNLFKGEQREDAYLAISPRGKVPLLATGEQYLSENIAILAWLASHFRDASLLPEPEQADWIRCLSDLAWFASGIHPIMTRSLIPSRFLSGEAQQADLRANATAALGLEFTLIDHLLADSRWWLQEWSALDAYLFWIWARSGEGPIERTRFPNFARHAADMLSLPEVRRALAREREYLPCFDQLGA